MSRSTPCVSIVRSRICSDQLGLGKFDISHAIKVKEYFDEDYVLYCMYLERLCC